MTKSAKIIPFPGVTPPYEDGGSDLAGNFNDSMRSFPPLESLVCIAVTEDGEILVCSSQTEDSDTVMLLERGKDVILDSYRVDNEKP